MSTTPANDAVTVLREQLQIVVYVLHGIVTETRLPNPDPAHICNLAERVLPESEQAIATTVSAATQPAGDTADKWRTLALQYDGHRMQAIWHLQAMLQDAAKHAPIAAEFLQAAPSSAPVAQAMPSQPPNVTSGSSFMVQMDSILRQAESNADGKISTAAVRETILAYQAVQAMPAAPSEAVSGIEIAAKFIERRADDYLRENASTDPDTGAVQFHYREAGRDYHSTLVELAEDIRALQGKPEQAGEKGGAA